MASRSYSSAWRQLQLPSSVTCEAGGLHVVVGVVVVVVVSGVENSFLQNLVAIHGPTGM
jgi:hypothetical protein